MSKPYIADILTRLRAAIVAWNNIDPELKFGSFARADFQAVLDQAEAIGREINSLELRLTDLRNQRDQVNSQCWNYVVRLRLAIKGIYGDDSSQYEMVGGTRRSERKPRTRRAGIE